MSGAKITLYIDTISPFGYLAFWLLRNSPAFENVKLELVPILLGGLHKQCNNTAPIFVKNKKEWINKERDRWSSLFSIPIRAGPPRTFPVSTVNSMRALVALQMEASPEEVAKVTEAFWAMIWNPDAVKADELRDEGGKGEFDVKSAETLKKVMGGVVGAELAGRVMGRIGEKDVKDRLSANTQRAFEAGAFGLPWFECENSKGEKEGFWGFDHVGMVCRFLGLDVDRLSPKGGRIQAML